MRALDQEVTQEPYGPKGQSSGVANTRLVALATNLTGCYSCPSDNTEGKTSVGRTALVVRGEARAAHGHPWSGVTFGDPRWVSRSRGHGDGTGEVKGVPCVERFRGGCTCSHVGMTEEAENADLRGLDRAAVQPRVILLPTEIRSRPRLPDGWK